MIIVDTGALVAAKDEDHVDHNQVAEFLMTSDEDLVLSPLVVAETDYLLNTRLGLAAALEFLDEVAGEVYELVSLDHGDVAAAAGICRRYSDMNIGVTDASLVVLAARVGTTRIMSLDQRHFRTVQPLWGAAAFTLLPYDS